MDERIKELRLALGLTQQQFADRIGLKRATISVYESGRNEPIETVITSICREFGVNEDWLRHGIGEMFQPQTDSLMEDLARRYGMTDTEKALLLEYMELPPEVRKLFLGYIKSAAKILAAAPAPEMSDDDYVRGALERQLADEKKGQTSSASGPGSSGASAG